MKGVILAIIATLIFSGAMFKETRQYLPIIPGKLELREFKGRR